MKVKVASHVAEVKGATKAQITAALEKCGLAVESWAKQNVKSQVSGVYGLTGVLANSMTHTVKDKTCEIGNNAEYAAYVEFGTGAYATMGGGSPPWNFQDARGQWHHTKGQQAKPFLKPAVADHTGEISNIIESECKK